MRVVAPINVNGRNDMLIVRGINVYPREIETVLLDDPDIGGQYAIIIDRRKTMAEMEIQAELQSASADPEVVAARLREQLLERIRLRVEIELLPPGGMPRQETGKAKRVYEKT